jgi:hypothetical protein
LTFQKGTQTFIKIAGRQACQLTDPPIYYQDLMCHITAVPLLKPGQFAIFTNWAFATAKFNYKTVVRKIFLGR